jgi:hypothetical protein
VVTSAELAAARGFINMLAIEGFRKGLAMAFKDERMETFTGRA